MAKKNQGGVFNFHEDRLLAALNKYFRPVSREEYLHQWDLTMTQNAIALACFPKEIEAMIWEEDRDNFEIY